MIRDLRALSDNSFDLLVVGAGIYGAAVAWDAAQRGLRVALIDQGDFGGGTSANSMKTVHGGVRSLQTGNPAELRTFVRERRALSRIAPHLVHPLPFVVPTYSGLTRHPLAMQAAFKLYDFLSADRNAQPDGAKHLPPSRRVSREECLALNPLIASDGVTGGIVWHDCQMYNPDRVVLAFVQSSVDAGAAVGNHLRATGWVKADDRIAGVSVEDRIGSERFDIQARLVVNAVGPWSSRLLDGLERAHIEGRPPGLSMAMNLVTRSVTTDHALGGVADGRFLFVAPWRGVTILGTSHDPYDGPGGSPTVRSSDVERFLADARDAFPQASLSVDDVRLVHRGLLPAADAAGHGLSKVSLVRDHRDDGVAGLLSVVGVRYTTARDTAETAVDTAMGILNRAPVGCRTAETPLHGGAIDDWSRFLAGATAGDESISPDTRRRLATSYGTHHQRLLEGMRREPALTAPLSETCPVTTGEILHAVDHEMALRLSDAVLRRTEAGSAGHPGPQALATAARLMGDRLGWSADDRAREISEVEATYRLDD